ncbi:HlyD family efflux transporter periplasmic adaptor subunit [Rhodoferax sp. 4810]|uniref:HlyD family efflux transporter periplasmic adaptor subunit n=1 Tax=Thiospirillum jenense TaxID=1653858 RepID=A0A839HEN3_9GAMM|nr:HlyD family efflux transporter periplasmic adaptor subunit [Thiospirillum jenense]MBB1073356.1 HlyD family efflux transporter periplasmic adaptor subunit [Rhodoferax jenense]MBB1125708.1 HlyD family efflux transporter periplasmic adaptor subunit [Thiospirillum jenense]
MSQLRDDLVFSVNANTGDCVIRDPQTQQTFEFGQQECYLLQQFQHSVDLNQIVTAVNTTYQAQYTIEEITEFLALLNDWGLLTPVQPNPAHSTPEQAAHHLPPFTDKTAASDSFIQQPNRWHLFNPQPLLDWLHQQLLPLQSVAFLIITPVVLFGILTIVLNWSMLRLDLATAFSHFSIITRLIFTAFTINLLSQLGHAIIARHYGVATPSFGIVFILGLIPRFNIQLIPTTALIRHARIKLASVGLIMRLWLLGGAGLIWLITRPSGHLLATASAELIFLISINLFFTLNPLLKGDGYRLITAFGNAPEFRARSFQALKQQWFGAPSAITRHTRYHMGHFIYAIAVVLFLIAISVFVTVFIGHWLESRFNGTGVVVLLLLIGYVIVTLLRQHHYQQRASLKPTDSSIANLLSHKTTHAAQSVPPHLITPPTQHTRSKYHLLRNSVVRGVWIAAIIGMGFIPYPYEIGGEFTLFPIAKMQMTAQADGQIETVLFNGGEWLERGTLIAQLAQHRQTKDVAVTRAALTAKQSEMQQLLTTPSIEEIALAAAQLATAQLKARYSRDETQRLETLFAKGTVSLQKIEIARAVSDLDQRMVVEREAALATLKTQINPHQIAIIQADIVRLEAELTFYLEQLKRTQLVMPVTGRIVTMQLKNKQNDYLEEGELFAEVEDNRYMRIEIAVPEFDSADVSIGANVTLKLWSQPAQIFHGQVKDIVPIITDKPYGQVMTVIGELPNDDRQSLKSGLTGYAKIAGRTMPLGIAFTKGIARFIQIEMWSWLP